MAGPEAPDACWGVGMGGLCCGARSPRQSPLSTPSVAVGCPSPVLLHPRGGRVSGALGAGLGPEVQTGPASCEWEDQRLEGVYSCPPHPVHPPHYMCFPPTPPWKEPGPSVPRCPVPGAPLQSDTGVPPGRPGCKWWCWLGSWGGSHWLAGVSGSPIPPSLLETRCTGGAEREPRSPGAQQG